MMSNSHRYVILNLTKIKTPSFFPQTSFNLLYKNPVSLKTVIQRVTQIQDRRTHQVFHPHIKLIQRKSFLDSQVIRTGVTLQLHPFGNNLSCPSISFNNRWSTSECSALRERINISRSSISVINELEHKFKGAARIPASSISS